MTSLSLEKNDIPFTNSFNYSDEIEMVINQQDVFLDMSNAELYIEGNFEEGAEGTGECKLTDNAGAFLFESVSYEVNGKEIERIRDPGIVSTVKSMLCLNDYGIFRYCRLALAQRKS